MFENRYFQSQLANLLVSTAKMKCFRNMSIQCSSSMLRKKAMCHSYCRRNHATRKTLNMNTEAQSRYRIENSTAQLRNLSLQTFDSNKNINGNKGSISNNHEDLHIPVMAEEVVDALHLRNGQVVLDMTFGSGGHARKILKSSPLVTYLAADRDPLAYQLATDMAVSHNRREGSNIVPILSRFSELPLKLPPHGVKPGTVDGVLMDLGVSSMQFDSGPRGFAISKDGPLDMRMDGARFPDMPTAADLVNTLDVHDMTHILRKYGEERRAAEVAQAIVEARHSYGKFTKTSQLAKVISSAFESDAFVHDKLYRHSHVATKTFMALRIFVNNELNEVHNGLEVARHFLKPGGRAAVISFHSLEDRIVKRQFHTIDMDEAKNLTIHQHYRNSQVHFSTDVIQEDFTVKHWAPVHRGALEPLPQEVALNPRARSARLRVATRTG